MMRGTEKSMRAAENQCVECERTYPVSLAEQGGLCAACIRQFAAALDAEDASKGYYGYIVWPEGQPLRARLAMTWLGMQWLMVGPMGWRAALNGRRMTCYWPAHLGEDYAYTAALVEAETDRRCDPR